MLLLLTTETQSITLHRQTGVVTDSYQEDEDDSSEDDGGGGGGRELGEEEEDQEEGTAAKNANAGSGRERGVHNQSDNNFEGHYDHSVAGDDRYSSDGDESKLHNCGSSNSSSRSSPRGGGGGGGAGGGGGGGGGGRGAGPAQLR